MKKSSIYKLTLFFLINLVSQISLAKIEQTSETTKSASSTEKIQAAQIYKIKLHYKGNITKSSVYATYDEKNKQYSVICEHEDPKLQDAEARCQAVKEDPDISRWLKMANLNRKTAELFEASMFRDQNKVWQLLSYFFRNYSVNIDALLLLFPDDSTQEEFVAENDENETQVLSKTSPAEKFHGDSKSAVHRGPLDLREKPDPKEVQQRGYSLKRIGGYSTLFIGAALTGIKIHSEIADSIERSLGNVSPTKSKLTPVKVTVYNSFTDIKDLKKPTFEERKKRIIGHTVLVVEPGDQDAVIVSYPTLDMILHVSDGKLDMKNLRGLIPEDQIAEFYTNRTSYRKFVVEFYTSELHYSETDVFNALDGERRDQFSESDMTSEFKNVLKERRKETLMFLKQRFPSMFHKDYVMSLNEIREKLKTYHASETDKQKEYDAYDFLLQMYLKGKKIAFEEGFDFSTGKTSKGTTYEIDPDYVFSYTKYSQLLSEVAEEYGTSSEDIEIKLFSNTKSLRSFGNLDEFYDVFKSKYGNIKSLQEFMAYLTEGLKRRTYYTTHYRLHEFGDKINCSGAVDKYLPILANGLYHYGFQGLIIPHHPQGVVGATRDMTGKFNKDEEKCEL